ncbi:translation elongation factor 4 [Candidatus Chlamydia sanziniae]|uniref:Elongation factor 4 n=1 Tax=Candidatus Chlamydia sanziniae TaxID=1806891 RepID=A0A1A9HVT3_9CHLA|nr:translation elongation factor 4 [Candidatus Chlamydia sanziniae]ANH79098.1 Translation elongation factor LepA [Candidatus Chlamydia sanziniae]
MKEYKLENIRNFSIIAHIDHGKSTIADRLLESTSTIEQREMREQLLDSMDLERERGITIKAHPVTMTYMYKGDTYELNLIDTPGHVDFSYEVSRSLAACEGALLIVDAAQGVQAQSLANVYLALERDLEIIPILNKIDLPAADPVKITKQIQDYIGLDTTQIILCSAKTGEGIDDILHAIIKFIPPPQSPQETILKALVFDSHYDPYVGIMVYVRIISGELSKGNRIVFMSSKGTPFEVLGVGAFLPKATLIDGSLCPGQVGYFIANIKKVHEVKIGDTVTSAKHPAKIALEGFKEIHPVVFAGIYPIDSSDFDALKDALTRLQLNDSALTIEQESSHSLGFGFRCGFLGLLHLEIIFERIIREFDLDIIATAPSVIYKVILKNGKTLHIDNPSGYPDPAIIEDVEEPWVQVNIITPQEYLSGIMNLCLDKRGVCIKTETLDHNRLVLSYDLPLNEIVTDFNDKLKSVTKGYGSFDYHLGDYRKGAIIKLEVLINEEPIDAFSCLVHRDKAESRGRNICEKLVNVIPQQLFKIPIQAAINKKIVARETIRALSKNVTAKCYGGDITRKRKLWEKQKKGKKRMKEFGKVAIPNTAFIEVLKLD